MIDTDRYAGNVEVKLNGQMYTLRRVRYGEVEKIGEIGEELEASKGLKIPEGMVDFIFNRFKERYPDFDKTTLLDTVPEIIPTIFRALVQGEKEVPFAPTTPER